MPAERVVMRHAREIIRLKFSACVPSREIARRLGVAASTVRETLKRFESAGLSWPLPAEMTDGGLETALYANRCQSAPNFDPRSASKTDPPTNLFCSMLLREFLELGLFLCSTARQFLRPDWIYFAARAGAVQDDA